MEARHIAKNLLARHRSATNRFDADGCKAVTELIEECVISHYNQIAYECGKPVSIGEVFQALMEAKGIIHEQENQNPDRSRG